MKSLIANALFQSAYSSFNWGSWQKWGDCSQTCGSGTRRRMRLCLDSNGNKLGNGRWVNCPGSRYDKEDCNTNECPSWSQWGDWSDCDAKCDGGQKSRKKTCKAGTTTLSNFNCHGSTPQPQVKVCNTQRCVEYGGDCEFNVFNRWYPYINPNGDTNWDIVRSDDNMNYEKQCRSQCAKIEGCVAYYYFQGVYHFKTGGTTNWSSCHLGYGDIHYAWYQPVGVGVENWSKESFELGVRSELTSKFGVLPATAPLMSVPNTQCSYTSHVKCKSVSSDFGRASYSDLGIKTDPVMPLDGNDKHHVTNGATSDCARRCTEIAGCSYFWVDHACNIIIGRYKPCSGGKCADPSFVTASGVFNDKCANDALFSTSHVKKSRFFCKFLTPTGADNLVQQLIDENDELTSSTPLGRWIFTTPTTDPLTKQSQYVNLKVSHPEGINQTSSESLTWISFTVETHTKTAAQPSQDKSLKNQPNPNDLWLLLSLSVEKEHTKNRRDTNNFDEFDSGLINSLLSDLRLPRGIKVLETTPVEVIQLSEVTSDGTTSADCSSGSCECVEGFKDLGQGCEVVDTVWSEWTNEACSSHCGPGTYKRTRTCGDGSKPKHCEGQTYEILSCNLGKCLNKTPDKYLEDAVKITQSLLDTVQLTGKQEQRKRQKLKNSWNPLTRKFTKKYKEISHFSSCTFPAVDEAEFTFDLSLNPCQNMKKLKSAFTYFGRQFTKDCRKERWSKDYKFYDRVSNKVDSVTKRNTVQLEKGGNC